MFSMSKLVTKARARIQARRDKRKAAKVKAPEADDDIDQVLANRECEVRERAALEADVDEVSVTSSDDKTPWPCPSPLVTPVFPVRPLSIVAATGIRPALRLPGQQKATKAVAFQGALENERYFWKGAAPVDLYPAHPIVGHPAHSAAVGLGAPKITASVNDVARAGILSADMEEILLDDDDDKKDLGKNCQVAPVCAATGTILTKVAVHAAIVIPPRTTSLVAGAIVIPRRTTSLLAAAVLLTDGATPSVSALAASAPASVSGLVPAASATAAAATAATTTVPVADPAVTVPTANVPAHTARRDARTSLYTLSNASTVSLGAMGDISEERLAESDESGDEHEDGSDSWSVEGQQVCADDADDDDDDSDADSDFGVSEKNLLAARTAYHKALAHSYEVRAQHRADAAKIAEEAAKKAMIEASSSETMFREPVCPLRRTRTRTRQSLRLDSLVEEAGDDDDTAGEPAEAGPSTAPVYRAPIRGLRRTNTSGDLRSRLNPLVEEADDAVGG